MGRLCLDGSIVLMQDEVPYGHCHCGCPATTMVAEKSSTALGRIKGQPVRFIAGHNSRSPEARRRMSAVGTAPATRAVVMEQWTPEARRRLAARNRTPAARAASSRHGQSAGNLENLAAARTTHGQKNTPTYRSWQAMVTRCTNPKRDDWKYYGGRGITVAAEWVGRGGFQRFLAHIGERPEGLSLDRIDNNGNYEPGNVRWATASEQRLNQRREAAHAD